MSEEEEVDEGFIEFELKPGDLSESGSESENEEKDDDANAPAPATVLYVGHLPFGFFEDEMKKFFGQFGKIANVKVARSSRTARSKGYGWVQFKSADVAAIACKTMNGYMMFKKKLECKILTPEQVAVEKLFRNSRRKMLPSRRPAIHKSLVNAPIDEERHAKQKKRQAAKRNRIEKKLEKLGIGYVLPGAEPKPPADEQKKAKKTKQVAAPAPDVSAVAVEDEKTKAKKKKAKVEPAAAAPIVKATQIKKKSSNKSNKSKMK